MSKKKRLMKLAKQEDDVEAPITWEDWDKFYGIDSYTLFTTAREYLIESGMPPADIEGKDSIGALCAAVNFAEWAPFLFRKLTSERIKEARRLKKTVPMDSIKEPSIDKTVKTVLMALFNKWLDSDELKGFGPNAKPILKMRLMGASQAEISKELGITRETVNRTWKKIEAYLK